MAWCAAFWFALGWSTLQGGERRGELFERPRAFRELNLPAQQPAALQGELHDEEVVVGVRRGEHIRAYPLRILGEHRVINDDLGGPLVVMWDADSGSARAFAAQIDDQRLSLRFQGWLLGVMVVRDAETGNLWSHLTGYSLGGTRRGSRLECVPVSLTSWRRWRDRWPKGGVPNLDSLAAYRITYPVDSSRISLDAKRSLGPLDSRLPAEERVLGVSHGGRNKAYRLEQLVGSRLDRLGGQELIISRDLEGDVSVIAPVLENRRLELSLPGEGEELRFRGDGGTVIDVTGRVLAGPHRGEQLPAVDSVTVKWFAWSAYHPETQVDGMAGPQDGDCPPILLPAPPAAVADDRPTMAKQKRRERRESRRKSNAR